MPSRLPILLLAAAALRAPQPLAPPATLPANALHSGDNAATYDVEQDDHTIIPDPNGIYHLYPAPFALHFHGDIDDIAVTASHNDKLITALAAEKRPILTLVATGCAYGEGELLVNDDSSLAPFDTFKSFFDKDADLYAKLLPARLGSLPVVLDASIEYSTAYAPPNAGDYIQKIDTLFQSDGSLFAAASTRPATQPAAAPPKLDWKKQTDLYLAILINSPAEVAKFKHAGFQTAHLRFDLK